jgi:hypothetical protein
MLRLTPIAPLLCVVACSATADLPAPIAPRTVLLQYSGRPASADSLAVSGIGGAPAMMYPIIHSITVWTSAPTSAFNGLNRMPEVDDVDSLDRACDGFGLLVLTNVPATAADSAVIISIGAGEVRMVVDGPNHVLGVFHNTKLEPVVSAANRLAGDSNIVTADLELGCLTESLRSRQNAPSFRRDL